MATTIDNDRRGELWSLLRDVLSQGSAIGDDYRNGVYAGYESYSARLDAAARERADQLAAMLAAREARQ